jgi:hypothetical protein
MELPSRATARKERPAPIRSDSENLMQTVYRNLSRICRKVCLLESCVNSNDIGKINSVSEDDGNPNQSFRGVGCRLGRDWVVVMLRKHSPFVYITATQPDHLDFPLIWPVCSITGGSQTPALYLWPPDDRLICPPYHAYFWHNSRDCGPSSSCSD